MKIAYQILLFGLLLNLSTGIIDEVFGISAYLVNTPTIIDPDDIAQSWTWGGGSTVGDISAGFNYFWNINVPFIESVPIILKNAGTPTYILTLVNAVWRFIWVGFIVEFISGRRLTGE